MTDEARYKLIIGLVLALILIISLSACSTVQYNMPQTESPKASVDSINHFNSKDHAINLL